MNRPAGAVLQALGKLVGDGAIEQVDDITSTTPCPTCDEGTLQITSASDDWTTLYCSARCNHEDVERALLTAPPGPVDPTSTSNGRAGGATRHQLSTSDREATGKPPKLRRLDVARMVREEPPPVPWIIEGLVVRGMLTVLNGREGEGKSLLAMALAAGVATGQDEAGLVCDHGKALIVDAENGEAEIHRRVRTLEVPRELVFFEAQGFDLRSDLGQLEAQLEEHRPDLLVLDSYRSLWGGEENDSREVAAVLDPLRNLVRRHGVGALLLHHSGKSNGGYRGSSAIGASAELGFRLARDEEGPDPALVFLETWKCRPAQKPPKRWLRLVVEGDHVFIDAAAAPEQDEPEPEAPVREELTPRVLAILTNTPQTRADIARAADRGSKDRSVGRVLDELVKSGRARRTEQGWQAARPLRGVATLPPSEETRIPEPKTGVAGGLPPLGGLPPSATPAEEAEFDRLKDRLAEWGDAQ